MQLGRELEKGARVQGVTNGDSGLVNGSKKARDRMQQICGSDGRVLVSDVEIRDRLKEHFKGLYGAADRSAADHQTLNSRR